MQRILLWGTGEFADKYVLFIQDVISNYHIEIVGFCDNDVAKWGKTYYEYQIYSPEELKNLTIDKIVILAYPNTVSIIMKQLVEKFRIPRNKIGNVVDIIKMAQKERKNNLTKVQTRSPQIYDCFPFFNELDILKIRLQML